MAGLVGEFLDCASSAFGLRATRASTHRQYGALAQLVERLLCKQDVNGSNPLGSTITLRSDLIGKQPCFPVQSDAASSEAFTSFREIISVVGCTRVWVQQGQSFGIGSNDNVVQVKYTNQMVSSCMGIDQKVSSGRKGREKYMLLIGSDTLRHKRAG